MTEDSSYESKAKDNLLQAGAAAKTERGVINALQGIGYAILHLAEAMGKQSLPDPGPIRTPKRDLKRMEKEPELSWAQVLERAKTIMANEEENTDGS